MAKRAKPCSSAMPERDEPPYMAAARQAGAGFSARMNATSTTECFREHLARQIRVLWLSVDGNDAKSAFPFALSARDVNRLRELLSDAHAILKTAAIVSLKDQAGSLDCARRDDAFQSFMQLQCIPAKGQSHA